MLAVRAFTFNLFPLTHIEIGTKFDLQHTLQYGSLPKLLEYDDPLDIVRYFKADVKTYRKEEIISEQIVRKN